MRVITPWLFSLALVAVGCEAFIGIDPGKLHGSGGGGSTPDGGSSSNGTGGAIQCINAFDCPGADSECHTRTCDEGRCGAKDAPAGMALSAQIPGDCKQIVCDGKGKAQQVDDPTDVLDDHNPCTADACAMGKPTNTAEPASAACGNGSVCDGFGHCVGCVVAGQCSGLLCVNNGCVPTSCVDQMTDGTETAKDCGGSTCGPCADALACKASSDCQSGVCTGSPKVCQPASCSDGVKNGDETDVDCGGSCMTACKTGQGCGADADCTGKSCSGAVCLPSCSDGVKNGGETGVDCGGFDCMPCMVGSGCASDGDCMMGVCSSGVCIPDTCANGMKDGTETDVDCGGGACVPCVPGHACAKGADCASAICAGAICATPSCADHVINGGETGVDCGGPCAHCPTGQGCKTGADCVSGLCALSKCVDVGCTDGVKDLQETDVDCGGPMCAGCPGGGVCNTGADCSSTVCDAGKCTKATCMDSLKNQGESDVDCGGPCTPCMPGGACLVPSDCDSHVCLGGVCATPTCNDSTKNGNETGADCGGPMCGPCPEGQGCLGPSDCLSHTCTSGLCAASCTDGIQDGTESDKDCGGSCTPCGPGKACTTGTDCTSKACVNGICTTPTCTDNVANGGETDVDCGGTCGPCALTLKCKVHADCASQGCISGKCVEMILLSEIRTHGTAGAGYGDDFIELYNPGNLDITMDSNWTVAHRSAQGGCQGGGLRFQGANQVLPPKHHFLIAGWEYVQQPPGDVAMLNSNFMYSLADAGSITVLHGTTILDTVCFYYYSATDNPLGALNTCMPPYACAGTPVSNMPHDGSGSPMAAVDTSIERKPGGAGGNATNTGDNASDWISSKPAHPQNLASPPTP